MRVFNADQRAKLLGAVTRMYLSRMDPDAIELGDPEPSTCGAGAWYPVKLFVRYDDAGLRTVDEIVHAFYARWRDAVHHDQDIWGTWGAVRVVDSVTDLIFALDEAGIEK